MTIGHDHSLIFHPSDEDRVWDVVMTLDPLRVIYAGPNDVAVGVTPSNVVDEVYFRVAHPEAEFHGGVGVLGDVTSAEAIATTLAAMSPSTAVTTLCKAPFWCADEEMERLFNSSIASASDQFVGPVPTIRRG